MKKVLILAIIASFAVISCEKKEQERENYQEQNSADTLRNDGVDSAALSAEPAQDSIQK